MRYFIYANNVVTGPFLVEELKENLSRGKISSFDLICAEGTEQWVPLSSVVPTDGGQLPPPPPGAARPDLADQAKEKVKFVAEQAGVASGLSMLFARRIFKSNFIEENASDEERRHLEAASPPVTARSAQNYMAWRRALLWFSSIALGLATLKDLIDYCKNFSKDNPVAITLWTFMFPVLAGVATVICAKACLDWREINQTRRLSLIAYLTQFVGPVLLLCFPIYKFIATGGDADAAKMMGLGMGWMFALSTIFLMVPKVLGIFPGLIRSSLTLKTLLPQHPLPAWIGIIVAPLFALFVLIPAIMAMQTGFFIIGLGLLCITCFPLTLLYWAKPLSAAATPDQMNITVTRVRSVGKKLFFGGLVLILIGARELLKNVELVSMETVGFLGAFFGNFLLLTVVCSDVILVASKSSLDQEKELFSSGHGNDLTTRMDELAQLGKPFPVLNRQPDASPNPLG